jgi:hypothetical protein
MATLHATCLVHPNLPAPCAVHLLSLLNSSRADPLLNLAGSTCDLINNDRDVIIGGLPKYDSPRKRNESLRARGSSTEFHGNWNKTCVQEVI